MIRVAIYGRYSSDLQSRHSADDQIRECTTYSNRQPEWQIVAIERDEAVRAGALAARDGYQRLVKLAEAKAFEILLVEEASRFNRSFINGMAELGAFAKLGVKLADTRSGVIDLSSAAGQMQSAVQLMMADQEVRKLDERSKRGVKGKVIGGFSGGGKPANHSSQKATVRNLDLSFVFPILCALDGRLLPNVAGNMNDAEVNSCVRKLASSWSFQPPSGGTCAVLQVPFQFSPKT